MHFRIRSEWASHSSRDGNVIILNNILQHGCHQNQKNQKWVCRAFALFGTESNAIHWRLQNTIPCSVVQLCTYGIDNCVLSENENYRLDACQFMSCQHIIMNYNRHRGRRYFLMSRCMLRVRKTSTAASELMQIWCNRLAEPGAFFSRNHSRVQWIKAESIFSDAELELIFGISRAIQAPFGKVIKMKKNIQSNGIDWNMNSTTQYTTSGGVHSLRGPHTLSVSLESKETHCVA